MARLVLTSPGGAVRSVPLVKRITSVGRGAEVDVRLEDTAAPEHALTLLWDGRSYRAGSVGTPFLVDGKKRDAHLLRDGDVIRVADTWIALSLSDAPAEPVAAADPGREALSTLQRLTEFSARLLQSAELSALLEALLDEAIDLTHGDRGFLVLVEGEQRSVRVARNVDPRERGARPRAALGHGGGPGAAQRRAAPGLRRHRGPRVLGQHLGGEPQALLACSACR